MSRLAAVFQIGSLGDSIVSIPVIRSLRELLPDCNDYILVSRFDTNMKVMPSDIFEMAKAPKLQVNYQGHGSRLAKAVSVASVISRLRYYRPRSCIYLMPIDRTAQQIDRDRKFFRAAGVRELFGFRTMSSSELAPPAALDSVQATEAYLRFRRVWNEQADERFGTYSSAPLIEPNQTARQVVNSWLDSYGINGFDRKVVAVCPYSNFDSKSWRLNVAAELVKGLAKRTDVTVVLIGGAKDKEAADGVIRMAGAGLNACGMFSPTESAALLERCRVVVSAASGPMHLAGALGIPTVATFSRISPSLSRWFPLGSGHTILYREVACAGCMKTHCPIEGHPCMNITADDLLSIANATLNGSPRASGQLINGTKLMNWEGSLARVAVS